MKIELPNGEKTYLDDNKTIEEKMTAVKELLEKWKKDIEEGMGKNRKIDFFLDNLANYIVWHKEDEEKGKEDTDVMSVKKVEQMSGKRKGKSIPFSSLSVTQKENFGLEGDSNDR